MDETDRLIIFNLLRDGRISQNKLAKIINLAPPSLNSRFRRLIDEGVIRGFKVFINPNLINKYFAYYAFPNLREAYSDKIFVKFNCLENFNVYGFQGESIEEIKETVDGISSELGKPIMEYIPPQTPIKPKKQYLLLIKTLVENPRAEISEIANKLNFKVSKVRRLISELKGFAVIPEVDLIKADSMLLAVFTKKLACLMAIFLLSLLTNRYTKIRLRKARPATIRNVFLYPRGDSTPPITGPATKPTPNVPDIIPILRELSLPSSVA